MGNNFECWRAHKVWVMYDLRHIVPGKSYLVRLQESVSEKIYFNGWLDLISETDQPNLVQ